MPANAALSNLDLATALREAERAYVQRHPVSAQRHERAKGSMPGGSTRAVLYYPPFPITMVRGEGCYVWGAEGNRYADFVCEYSAGLFGHSDPTIRAAIDEALDAGVVLGAPNRYEAELSDALVRRFPSLDLVRFCNSGTEANIMAIAAARAVTERPKILVFQGAYHGGVLTFGPGGSALNLPFPIVLGRYNDADATKKLLREQAAELAAVVIEPMLGGGGCIPAAHDFLQMLRDETERHGIILIFDEVMTSRLGPGGLQGRTGVIPDMMTAGKYLGGGLSFGAFGGRRSIMGRFDPSTSGAFAHGGTFNNNVLSMAAGLAGVTRVFTSEAAERLTADGEALRARLNAAAERRGLPVVVTGCGSLMNVHFTRTQVTRPEQVVGTTDPLRRLFQFHMIERGQYMTPRGMLALSLPMGAVEFNGFVSAFEDFLDENVRLLSSIPASEHA